MERSTDKEKQTHSTSGSLRSNLFARAKLLADREYTKNTMFLVLKTHKSKKNNERTQFYA